MPYVKRWARTVEKRGVKIGCISLFLLFSILLLNFCFLNAQDNKQYSIEGDSVLKKIKEKLPNEWSIYFQNNRLCISRNSAFVAVKQEKVTKNDSDVPMAANINAMRQPETIRYKNFTRYLDLIGPRMTKNQLYVATLNNKRIQEQIDKLPEKYNLKRGLPRGKSPVGPLIFPSEEIERAFREEKEKLEARKIDTPTYYSQNYCFGSISGDWLQSNYTLSVKGVDKEIEKVNRLLETYLGKY